ncbi:hypothetical protein [Algoriphagus formosus]|uniref:hypothetical protein n=1 Tax=Algoriphagus formosus TaxID=2007308 RepID=UPI003F730E63
MLRSLIYITLAWTMVLNSMVYSVIKVNFSINRKYIIENFCINKDKPELACDGKCFLMQKINEEKERQESLPAFTFNKDFGVFISPSFEISEVALSFNPYLKHSSMYFNRFGQNVFFTIEHPPKG